MSTDEKIFLNLKISRNSQEQSTEWEEVNNINYRDARTGQTYLHLACQMHDVEAIKMLFKKGIDANVLDNRGCDALFTAIGVSNEKNEEILRLFLKYGYDLSRKMNNHTVRDEIYSFPRLTNQDFVKVIKEYENNK